MSEYQKEELKHKILLTLSVIFLCGIILVAVLRFSGDPNADFTYSDFGEGIVIEGCSGSPATLQVPASIDGKTVLAVAESAFTGQTKLKKVILPDTVTSIGATAFADCKNLTRVEGAGVVAIGEGAFQSCVNLKKITLSPSLERIEDRAFQGCGKLQELTVSSALSQIGTDALAGCGNLVLHCNGNSLAEEVASQYSISTDGSDTGRGMWIRLGAVTIILCGAVLIPLGILSKKKKQR